MYKSQIHQDELEGCAITYDLIRETMKNHRNIDEEMANDFASHIHQTLEKLENTLFYRSDLNNYEQTREIQVAKNNLYAICEAKFIDLLNFYNPNLASIFEQIYSTKNQTINELVQVFQLHLDEQSSLQQQIEQSYNQQLISQQQKFQQQIQDLQQSQQQELQTIKQNYQNMISEYEFQLQNKDQSIINQQATLDEQIQHHNSLNQENDLLQNVIQSLTQDKKDQITTMNNLNQTINSQLKKQKKYFRENQLEEQLQMLYDIYDFNKNRQETMEKSMYAFFSQKFGSKSMVVDQAGSLIQGLDGYDSNIEVKAWAKVFRNECDVRILDEIFKIGQIIESTLASYLRNHNGNYINYIY